MDIYRQILHFDDDYHWFTARFIKKSRHLKYQNADFQKEQLVMNYMQYPWHYEIKLTSKYITLFATK